MTQNWAVTQQLAPEYCGEVPTFASTDQASTILRCVISDGAPKRLGGPQ